MTTDETQTETPEVTESESTSQETETETQDPKFESQLLMSMMADKEIRAVLDAKREGQAVEVSVGTASPEGHEEIPDEDLDDLDPGVQKVIALLDKKFSPILDRLDRVEQSSETNERKVVDTQIADVADKFSDFNTYRKDMAKISKTTPGLSIEELYVVAKSRAGDLSVSVESTESERPTPTPRSPLNKDTKSDPRRGRKGFKNILADALEKSDLSSR